MSFDLTIISHDEPSPDWLANTVAGMGGFRFVAHHDELLVTMEGVSIHDRVPLVVDVRATDQTSLDEYGELVIPLARRRWAEVQPIEWITTLRGARTMEWAEIEFAHELAGRLASELGGIIVDRSRSSVIALDDVSTVADSTARRMGVTRSGGTRSVDPAIAALQNAARAVDPEPDDAPNRWHAATRGASRAAIVIGSVAVVCGVAAAIIGAVGVPGGASEQSRSLSADVSDGIRRNPASAQPTYEERVEALRAAPGCRAIEDPTGGGSVSDRPGTIGFGGGVVVQRSAMDEAVESGVEASYSPGGPEEPTGELEQFMERWCSIDLGMTYDDVVALIEAPNVTIAEGRASWQKDLVRFTMQFGDDQRVVRRDAPFAADDGTGERCHSIQHATGGRGTSALVAGYETPDPDHPREIAIDAEDFHTRFCGLERGASIAEVFSELGPPNHALGLSSSWIVDGSTYIVDFSRSGELVAFAVMAVRNLT